MALDFGSAGDEVNFGTAISKLSVFPYTILSWEFPTSDPTDGRITNRASAGLSGHMQFTETAILRLRVRQTFATAEARAVSLDNFMILNEWAFYAGTIDSGRVARLFRSKPDENSMTEATYSSQITGSGALVAKESEEFLIGNSSDGGQFFIGRQANVSIYNRELTENEMLAVKAGIFLEGLLLFAPLWGVASPEPDLSQNPETGVVTGATQVDGPPVAFYAPFPGGYESAAIALTALIAYDRGTAVGIERGILRGV